ncbi:MAG: ribose 5-phosphate isomerase A [Thaumarchaeota archaeon]|nr:ribose 5-phosphate isomerase A [Nitrososphaerota archaeon]
MNNSFVDALTNISKDALKFITNDSIIALGSGNAATIFTKTLSKFVNTSKIRIKIIPTSLQIKLIIEKNPEAQLMESSYLNEVDIMFDGADQIDSQKNLVKGGGGALLRENILMNMAKKVIIIADSSKFVNKLNTNIPIEIHQSAREYVIKKLIEIKGAPLLRVAAKGYPVITENGNIIIDCNFDEIDNPQKLSKEIISIAGVLEVGIFKKKPDVIYKANLDGSFDIL